MDAPRSPLFTSKNERVTLLVRTFLVACGWISLALGFLGIFLPLLPTTPFILLAAACFARGSEKFYTWLLNHRWMGPPLRDWQRHKSIPKRYKAIAIGSLAVSVGFSVTFFVPKWPVKIGILCVCSLVALWILRIPTRKH